MNTLIIDARQTGKSNKLYRTLREEFDLESKNSLVLVPRTSMRDDFAYRFNINRKYITSDILNMPFLTGYKLYIDEYFMLPHEQRRKVFNLAISGKISVFAIGTPTKSYRKEDVELAKRWWKLSMDADYRDILKDKTEMIDMVGAEIFYSLLSLPDINVEEPTANRFKMVGINQAKFEIVGDIWA